ncbi:dihydrofolate reductase family protein [uncultured Chitinophaga sp.]|jgi:Dihydrofolate reductase|uniref:dihydrofolate reductase family protein n=1 Tax=uncultured Chitinophaga sp. TaxID=339340 RepID=UPI0026247FDC|nr:dihydrofolate reductase family protein [uncultured Chitinophaga sp.]
MRKIILDLAVTLDSLIEGPNGEYDWCILDEEANSSLDALLNDIDTIFYGSVSYDLWGNYQPEEDASPFMKDLFKAVHSKEKVVFSKTKSEDGKATFIRSDIEQQVKAIKNKPGKNIWLYGGAGLIRTFMELDLIDEFRLAVHPVILGQGKPLFSNISKRTNLKLKSATPSSSGVIILVYEAAR